MSTSVFHRSLKWTFCVDFCLHYLNALLFIRLLTDRPWQLLSVCVCSRQRLQAKMGQRSERRWAAVTENDTHKKKCFHCRVKYLNNNVNVHYLLYFLLFLPLLKRRKITTCFWSTILTSGEKGNGGVVIRQRSWRRDAVNTIPMEVQAHLRFAHKTAHLKSNHFIVIPPYVNLNIEDDDSESVSIVFIVVFISSHSQTSSPNSRSNGLSTVSDFHAYMYGIF